MMILLTCLLVVLPGATANAHECEETPLITGTLHRVTDSRLTASTQYASSYVAAYSRLQQKRGAGGWCASQNNIHQWIQADFGTPKLITSVSTQGLNYREFVTSYNVKYSNDGRTWTTYMQGGSTKAFAGNSDENTVRKHRLTPFIARYVRLNPVTWGSHLCLRWEVYGCQQIKGCSETPIISGYQHVRDNQLSASSVYMYDSGYGPQRSRLNTTNSDGNVGGWCSGTLNTAQWIQVDFKKRKNVVSVATRGRTNTSHRVSSYHLQYSDDGCTWTTYGSNKTFTAASDADTIQKYRFPIPFIARYVRLNPRTWNRWICLRWELYSCHLPNGCQVRPLINGTTRPVNDAQLTASSEYGRTGSHGPARSRLNTPDAAGMAGAWNPISANTSQWIQVDFQKHELVRYIATQGRDMRPEWVKSYSLLYSDDGTKWKTYKEGGRNKVFIGNSDHETIHKHQLRFPFYARFVRLNPQSWHNWIALRFEVYGCQYQCTGTPYISGSTHRVNDSQLTASTEYGNGGTHGAARSRVNTMDEQGMSGGWCAASRDTKQWIQVDFKKEVSVVAVATQGRHLNESEWVTSYSLQHSAEGISWTTYQHGQSNKTFTGNTDQDTIIKHELQLPVLARYVRLLPETWHGGVCLRWEVYACDLE